MSVQKDTSLWEFLERRNLDSTQNLNLLASMLLTNKDDFMNAYGWEYEEWLDETSSEEFDEDELAYRLLEQEEREFEKKALNI